MTRYTLTPLGVALTETGWTNTRDTLIAAEPRPDPLDPTCPTCKAATGTPCRAPRLNGRSHIARADKHMRMVRAIEVRAIRGADRLMDLADGRVSIIGPVAAAAMVNHGLIRRTRT